MRLPLVVAAAAVLCFGLGAHADTIIPVPMGTYSGTQLATTGSTNIPSTKGAATFTESVYADYGVNSNPYCSGCLDFVITVSDPTIGYVISDVHTTSFTGYLTSVAYANDGDTAPYDATISSKGNKVSFSFGDSGLFNDESDPLIIYTNALDYTTGGITFNTVSIDPPAFAPSGTPYSPTSVTPEPSSLILLGTGLLGFAGAIRRRLV